MSDDSFDQFVINMNHKARSGAYDNKHPLEEIEKRARGGDENARSALLMRTGQDIEGTAREPPSSEEIEDMCST